MSLAPANLQSTKEILHEEHAVARRQTFDDLAYWQAANYLTVGQLYLRANPLVRKPLLPTHVRRHPLGSWAGAARLNLVYAQLNRFVRRHGTATVLLGATPRGRVALAANLWLEANADQRSAKTMREFFAAGGEHAEPPSSFAELDVHLARLGGAAILSNAGLVVRLVEARCLEHLAVHYNELSHSGALVVPVVSGGIPPLSGAHPAGAALATPDSVVRELVAQGFQALRVDEREPCMAHAAFGAALEDAYQELRGNDCADPAFRPPAVVLRTPVAWDTPALSDGFALDAPRAGAVVLPDVSVDADQLALLEEWLLSYEPSELFDAKGFPAPRVTSEIPGPTSRLGAVARHLVELDAAER